MERWLKAESSIKSDGKLDEQLTASSTSVPDVEPTQGCDTESCSDLPSLQAESNEK